MTTITIKVKTNRDVYPYEGYPINGTPWSNESGNYFFAKRTESGWSMLYAGKAKSFNSRFDNHEKLPLAKQRGATYIFAHSNNNEHTRSAEEADIINYYQPPLNKLLK